MPVDYRDYIAEGSDLVWGDAIWFERKGTRIAGEIVGVRWNERRQDYRLKIEVIEASGPKAPARGKVVWVFEKDFLLKRDEFLERKDANGRGLSPVRMKPRLYEHRYQLQMRRSSKSRNPSGWPAKCWKTSATSASKRRAI